jgi:carbohydrate-selective porin OprB
VRTLLTSIRSGLLASLGLVLALLLPVHGTAGAETAHRPVEPRVFGDMEWRNKLFDKGVDLQLVYVSEFAYNLGGGVRQLVDYTQQVAVGTTFDLERIVGLKDAVIQVTYSSSWTTPSCPSPVSRSARTSSTVTSGWKRHQQGRLGPGIEDGHQHLRSEP